MPEAFTREGLAVITGGASGIGRAAALKAVKAGMKVAIVDVNQVKLAAAAEELGQIAKPSDIWVANADVSDLAAMTALAGQLQARWGAPHLLMNNAAAFVTGGAGGILDPIANWQRLFAVNVLGIVNGVQAFLPAMLAAGKPAIIVNTGSKQGLTNPPGNPAYNTTKAAVNAYTQNLARDLRDRPNCAVSAHLLIPGWTTTGDAEHRPGAWLPGQVVDFMAEAVSRDDFFILCPDGETTPEMDQRRVLWNALDIVRNRPALSRWHKDYKEAFAQFMRRPITPFLED